MAEIVKPKVWHGKNEARGYIAGYKDAMKVAGTVADAWPVAENTPTLTNRGEEER
jgi:hypothetical protein